MKKVKWLYSELGHSIEELSDIFKSNQYSNAHGRGLILSSRNRESLSGRYIEKIVKVSRIVDPFGEETYQELTSYYTCNFQIQAKSSLLCIIDPPRTIRNFVSYLHSLLGLGLVISEVTVDPYEWLMAIDTKLKIPAVTNITATGIRMSEHGLAKVNVAGKKDVRADFFELLNNRRYKIDCLKFELEYEENITIKCELTKLGSCSFKAYNSEEVLNDLRISLEKVCN